MAKQSRNERRSEVGSPYAEPPPYVDLHAMRMRGLEIQLIEEQIASAKAEREFKHERAGAARAAKSEGSAARARKVDLVIVAALAELSGYLNGTDSEDARALIRDAEKIGIPLEIDERPIDPRTIMARLAEARKFLAGKQHR